MAKLELKAASEEVEYFYTELDALGCPHCGKAMRRYYDNSECTGCNYVRWDA